MTFYDFELAVMLCFLLGVFARQMFARLRDNEPLQTMAYTLFGLLYVLWLFNFMTKIVYVLPRSETGAVRVAHPSPQGLHYDAWSLLEERPEVAPVLYPAPILPLAARSTAPSAPR